MGFSTRNWIWILRKKIGVLTPWATSLAPSITPSVFQNHCLRTVILKCDPDGLLCETLSCGLQGQNFDSGILFALPPTLSEMPWSFPEAVWHHYLIELVTEPNIKTQVSSTKPGLERDTEVNNRLEHVRPFSVIFFFETHRSLWFGFVFVTIYMLFVLTWSGLIALLFFLLRQGLSVQPWLSLNSQSKPWIYEPSSLAFRGLRLDVPTTKPRLLFFSDQNYTKRPGLWEGTCCLAWCPKFNSQDTRAGRRELTLPELSSDPHKAWTSLHLYK